MKGKHLANEILPFPVYFASKKTILEADERRRKHMKGFMAGMLLGIAAGAAADMALHSKKGKSSTVGKAVRTASGAVTSAANTVQQSMGR